MFGTAWNYLSELWVGSGKEEHPADPACKHLHFELRGHNLIPQGTCLNCGGYFDLREGFRTKNWKLVKCEAVLEKGEGG